MQFSETDDLVPVPDGKVLVSTYADETRSFRGFRAFAAGRLLRRRDFCRIRVLDDHEVIAVPVGYGKKTALVAIRNDGGRVQVFDSQDRPFVRFNDRFPSTDGGFYRIPEGCYFIHADTGDRSANILSGPGDVVPYLEYAVGRLVAPGERTVVGWGTVPDGTVAVDRVRLWCWEYYAPGAPISLLVLKRARLYPSWPKMRHKFGRFRRKLN